MQGWLLLPEVVNYQCTWWVADGQLESLVSHKSASYTFLCSFVWFPLLNMFIDQIIIQSDVKIKSGCVEFSVFSCQHLCTNPKGFEKKFNLWKSSLCVLNWLQMTLYIWRRKCWDGLHDAWDLENNIFVTHVRSGGLPSSIFELLWKNGVCKVTVFCTYFEYFNFFNCDGDNHL